MPLFYVSTILTIKVMLKTKTLYAFIVAITLGFFASLTFSPVAHAATKLDPNAKPVRVNRMTIQMGNVFFYDSKTTDSDWSFSGIGLECSAKIKYTPASSSGETGTTESWSLTYAKKNEAGTGCGPENKKTLSKPTNWSDRQYVIFAGGESDGKIISVKPDSSVSFTKKGTYNGNTVYIQDGVDAYSCPLVIRKNNDWYLKPLEKKDDEDNVSNQIRNLFDKEFGVGDTACGPTDNDDLKIFDQFGLPESYYDAGNEKDHYGTTDFGFDGNKVAGAQIYVYSIADAAGIAQNGPLKGGGYTGSDESGDITGSGDGDESQTSCGIDGIGWIICPVMNFLAEANEKAFGFLDGLLAIRPSLVTDTATKDAWSKFRDLANVAFVIAFLVIIYSQITSVGVSNYGIKKLLPKIAAAAILVNISLFICQILVDASNIAGASLYSFIAGIVPASGGGGAGEGIWTGTMTVLLAGGVGVLLIVAIGAAPAVLLALALILFILIARQAFILLLVVVAPLAFVAYLLPNTENLFKKWWKALTATLLVYPIIAVIFGASTLASNILMNIADKENGDDQTLLKIVAVSVMAIPLFAVPAVLKGAMNGAGAVGAKLSNLQDRANRRAATEAGKEYKSRGQQLGTRMLNSNSRTARAASFVTGVRRRASRNDRIKQTQSQYESAQENFLNRGVDTSDPNNITATTKTAQRRVDAAAAKKTADTTNQVVGNLGAQASMSGNAALYRAAATSSEATHHQEDTLKNQGKSDYYNDRRNDGHLAENLAARENSQADETNALNRAKVGSSTESIAARQAIAGNKAAKGAEKIVDQRLERDFQTSGIGRSQSQALKAVEGELEIEHGEQKNIFEGSAVGQAQAQQKKVVQGTAKIIEGEAQLAYEGSAIGQTLTEASLGLDSQVSNANKATALKYEKSAVGVANSVAAATMDGKISTAKAASALAYEKTQDSTDNAVAAAVIQAQTDAEKAETAAYVQELKAGPQAGTSNLNPGDVGYQASVDLSAADIKTRAQNQRSANAQNIASGEYAKQVADTTTGLATVAGGIDKHGEARAVAAATQVEVEQFGKNVSMEQSTMSEMSVGNRDPDKDLIKIVEDPTQSAERRAAAAGMIMKNGAMKDIHKLLEVSQTLGDDDDEAAKGIRQIMMSDKNRTPFGLSSGQEAALKRGERIKNDSGTPITSYGEMLVPRAEKKISDQKWAGLDPDDQAALATVATSGGLSDPVLQDLVDATNDAEKNDNISTTVEAKRHTAAILAHAAARGITPTNP